MVAKEWVYGGKSNKFIQPALSRPVNAAPRGRRVSRETEAEIANTVNLVLRNYLRFYLTGLLGDETGINETDSEDSDSSDSSSDSQP